MNKKSKIQFKNTKKSEFKIQNSKIGRKQKNIKSFFISKVKANQIGDLIKTKESENRTQRAYKGDFLPQKHSYDNFQTKLKSKAKKAIPTEEDQQIRLTEISSRKHVR